MDGKSGLVGCLAVIGGFVLVFFLLTTFWGVAVSFGPFGFAVIMALVFMAGYFVGSSR